MRPLLRLVICCIVLLAAAAVPAAAAASGRPDVRLFAPDSVWNLPLRADAPIKADSAAYVEYLQWLIRFNGTWLNSTSCGMPLYWADAATPTVKVKLDHPS